MKRDMLELDRWGSMLSGGMWWKQGRSVVRDDQHTEAIRSRLQAMAVVSVFVERGGGNQRHGDATAA